MKRIIAALLVMFLLCATAAADMQETVMSYEQFLQAKDGSRVCVEAYVQAAQIWKNGGITLYLQDRDHGAYYAYDVTCAKVDAKALSIPGTKIRLEGVKDSWNGETEIINGVYEILADEPFLAEPEDVTELLGKSELAEHMNEKVVFKGLKIIGSTSRTGKEEMPFLYDWDGLGSMESNSDLYFFGELNGVICNFCVESDLCGNHTDVYETVQGLQIGDVIDCEAFLYWYDGANPHVTTVTVRDPVSGADEPEETETDRQTTEIQEPKPTESVADVEPVPQTEKPVPAEEVATEAMPEATTEPDIKKPAEPEENQAITVEDWVCPNCGKKNTAKFCGGCGTEKPEPEPETTSWICPNCGTENEGKFCGKCGTARPEPGNRNWVCPNCGTENTTKFCSECGNARSE